MKYDPDNKESNMFDFDSENEADDEEFEREETIHPKNSSLKININLKLKEIYKKKVEDCNYKS